MRQRHHTRSPRRVVPLALFAFAALLSMGAKRCERTHGCFQDGEHYHAGESFPSSDGCNTCSCGADGQIACTLRACAPLDAGVDGGTCTLGDAEFAVGESVVCADGCNQCTCEADDQWSSTLVLCQPNLIEQCDGEEMSSQGLTVTPLYREGDALALSVQYGGGCFTHTFKLCYSGSFLESSPVQTPIWVVDTSEEVDICLALPTVEHAWDLTPLREFYSEQYPDGPNTLLLNLDRNQIEYDF